MRNANEVRAYVSRWAVLVAVLVSNGLASTCSAGWQPDGNQLCTVPGQKTRSTLLASEDGSLFLVWEDGRGDLGNDLYCSRLTGLGELSPSWPSEGVAICTASGFQGPPVVISDAAGGAFIAWIDTRGPGFSTYAQRVSSTGASEVGWPLDGRAVCEGTGGFPVMAPDGVGGAFIAWGDSRQSEHNHDIYGQRLTATASLWPAWPEGGTAISGVERDDGHPAILPAGEAGAFVAWESFVGSDVFVQRISGDGAPAAGWPADGLLVCAAASNQRDVVMAPDGQGGIIAAWYDARSDNGDIYAQRITGDGSIAPGWAPAGTVVCAAAQDQVRPSIVALGTGDVMIAWADHRSGTGYQVYAQRLTASGTVAAGWPADGIAVSGTPSDGGGCLLSADGVGGAIIVWVDQRQDDGDIFAQRIGETGTKADGWPMDGVRLCGASGTQFQPAIASDGAGGAFVSWTDGRSIPFGDIFVTRVTSGGVTGVAIVPEPPRTMNLSVGPNPMRDKASIRFRLAAPASVDADVFDLSGRHVAVLATKQPLEAGPHVLEWDGRSPTLGIVRSGVYLVRVTTESNSLSARIVVFR